MKMPRPTEAEKALFRSLLPEGPGVTERPMFGQLAGFVNGNMFMCLFGNRIALKLPADAATELQQVPGAEPFMPMEGRPMRGYVMLPPAWHENPDPALEWIEKSVAYTASLPVKVKKPATKKRVAKPSQGT